MYRYRVDDTVTYTADDFVLFRESPFACWMERLTLENPDHGIPPDSGSTPPLDQMKSQVELADTLRAEGKDVRLIDWDADEAQRRSATFDAMREGADFIVNGQLALGSLSGAANLLMRTSGYSELGDFLYIPCATQDGMTPDPAFRLCFQAELLHSQQGQLPPQMLIIRHGEDLVPLQTESHIYHYRAVKQRFMDSMSSFRPDSMPDPVESAHFGRWADSAHEVIKQRLQCDDEQQYDAIATHAEQALRSAVGCDVASDASPYDLDDIRPLTEHDSALGSASAGEDSAQRVPRVSSPPSLTLVEQARVLKPGTYKAGPGVYRFGPPRAVPSPIPEKRKYNRRVSDVALQNLEFIGSGQDLVIGSHPAEVVAEPQPDPAAPPAPKLRYSRDVTPAPVVSASLETSFPSQAPGPDRGSLRDGSSVGEPAARSTTPPRPEPGQASSIDMDGSYPVTPSQALTTASVGPVDCIAEEVITDNAPVQFAADQPDRAATTSISNRLITSQDCDS